MSPKLRDPMRWVWNALGRDDGQWWRMGLASYAYSRCHGLSRWDSFKGGIELAWEYLCKRLSSVSRGRG